MTDDSQAEFRIRIQHGDQRLVTLQWLPAALVRSARRSRNLDLRESLARKIYHRWRRTPQGRAHDDGIPFTYAQLRIRKLPASHARQLHLFHSK